MTIEVEVEVEVKVEVKKQMCVPFCVHVSPFCGVCGVLVIIQYSVRSFFAFVLALSARGVI